MLAWFKFWLPIWVAAGMLGSVVGVCLSAPPQSTLPADPVCKCGDSCPCKAPATGKQSLQVQPETWIYNGVPHTKHADGVWRPTRNYPAIPDSSTNYSIPSNSSPCANGSCAVPQRRR